MTLKLLITGFEPFGGDPLNPSAMLAEALEGSVIEAHRVHARVLPCVFTDALLALNQAIDETRPALVLCTGLAAGRSELSFERVAINLIDARIADNAGAAPVDERVLRSTRDAWFTSLPVKAMAQACEDAGVSAALSLSAGTFVCNAVFFALMQRIERERRLGRKLRGGFMHVPMLGSHTSHQTATMTLEDMLLGTRAALAAALTQPEDLRVAAGTVA